MEGPGGEKGKCYKEGGYVHDYTIVKVTNQIARLPAYNVGPPLDAAEAGCPHGDAN